MLYKWDLLERPKISKLWGIHHKFHLAHPILIRPMELERGNIIELQKKESFIPRRAKTWEIQQKKDCLAEPPQNQGLKVILGQHATQKWTSTPNKPPDNPTWTLDEGEELCRDINDLQKKIVTNDELQDIMEGLKGEIMEVLKHFVT